MTFDELFSEHRLTEAERHELVHYLAWFRMYKTIQRLLPKNSQ